MNEENEETPSRHDETRRDVARHDETQRDMSRYSLTAEAASLRFSDAGVPRSPRTVMRYCQVGHLDCIKIDTENRERYLVTPDSVERRIDELLSVDLSRHVATDRTEPQERTASESSAKETEIVIESLRAEIEQLEADNLDLKIVNRGKDELVKLLREERSQFVAELRDQAHRIGQLEERLRLPPGNQTRIDSDAGPEVRGSDSVSRAAGEARPAPSRNVSSDAAIHSSGFGSAPDASRMKDMNGEDEHRENELR